MDVRRIREDFPILRKGDIVYMDSACQSLKPDCVMEAMDLYNNEFPACGGRSVHRLANRVSIAVDEAREKLASLIGAGSAENVVFTKNCTEALNTIASGLDLREGDKVVTTDIEHNSNHVPWLRLKENGVRRGFAPTADGVLDLDALQEMLDPSVKVVSMVHTSNVTGTTLPAREVVRMAHDNGSLVVLDGAQHVGHAFTDVGDLDVDFYTVSVQKILGPTGLGLLYGKEDLLKDLRPLSVGGGTVGLADYDSVDLLPPPERFEAGLLNYAGIIGAGVAADYLMDIGLDNVREHETSLNRRLKSRLSSIPEVEILGPEDAGLRAGITSFNVKTMGSHDVAMILDDMAGVLVRSGMHCCHPWFQSRGIPGCVRASMHVYNDHEDVSKLGDAVDEMVSTFCR